jgi:DNA-binding NarL/FixJ family response regulator
MPEGLRVAIADDHIPMLLGVRDALERDGWDVVGVASDAAGVIALAREYRPDVCLVDIMMPGNGISATRIICREFPDVAVVMLTASRDDRDLFDALRAGAVGYLLKDVDPDRLGAALRGVLNGEAALPRYLVTRVLEEFRGRERRRALVRGPRGSKLTSREFEVLDLLREGLTTEDVARRLFVSPVTVRGHVAAALKKLKVPDRGSAFRLLGDHNDRA